MTQDISRRWQDEDEAKQITNYPAPETIPQSLKDRLAVELLVLATCPNPDCMTESHYYSSCSQQTVECTADDCGEEFILA